METIEEGEGIEAGVVLAEVFFSLQFSFWLAKLYVGRGGGYHQPRREFFNGGIPHFYPPPNVEAVREALLRQVYVHALNLAAGSLQMTFYFFL